MSENNHSDHGNVLGRQTDYIGTYTASLLCPIPRQNSREALALEADRLPFSGVDLWTGYELSWLNPKGKPIVAVAEFSVPAESPNIIESKSFKLYLNSFNQSVFASNKEVAETMRRDLSTAAGAPVQVSVHSLQDTGDFQVSEFDGVLIDNIDVEIDCYTPQSSLLCLDDSEEMVEETLYSDLLKSNCPVTSQPDWASVYVRYSGPKINRAGLLKYIVSFRSHQDFHEHCVERMFLDILQQCQPESLTVYARYTRRGGLDINPYRTNGDTVSPLGCRLVRQ